MKEILLAVFLLASFVFAQEIVVNQGDTLMIKDTTFEKFSGDFIIKNNGVLILENVSFVGNSLGSTTNEAVFVNDKIIAPVINYGELSVNNCVFKNNFAWNAYLTKDFSAQASAGAIVNFGELDLADNNVFENNSHQSGNFVVVKNSYIKQFEYIGNDLIYNVGEVDIIKTEQGVIPSGMNLRNVEVVLLNNPVKDKAEFLVNTNKPGNVKINVLNGLGNLVFSTTKYVSNKEIIEWNLNNNAGKNVASGMYKVIVEPNYSGKDVFLGVYR